MKHKSVFRWSDAIIGVYNRINNGQKDLKPEAAEEDGGWVDVIGLQPVRQQAGAGQAKED